MAHYVGSTSMRKDEGRDNNDKVEEQNLAGNEALRVERVFPIRIETSADVQKTFHDLAARARQKPSNLATHAASNPNLPGLLQTDDAAGCGPPEVSLENARQRSSPSGNTHFMGTIHELSSDRTNRTAAQQILRCEDEPIHLPEAVQQFGALIALRETESGQYSVRIASENSQGIIGHGPDGLFALHCFTQLLKSNEKHNFLSRINSRKQWQQMENPKEYPDIFTVMFTSPPLLVYCALHYLEHSDLFICEFEPKIEFSTDIPPENSNLPDESVNVIDNQASEKERAQSTTRYSRPLRTVQRAKLRYKELDSGVTHPSYDQDLPRSLCEIEGQEMFYLACEIQEQLNSATSISSLLDIIVGVVSDLTGFHRVMVYQFDENRAGEVKSEFIDERASIDLYRGLHFPAADVPAQARELYKLNKTRALYDRTQATARLVYRTSADAKSPLDLSMSYLRAMSPVHLKYLANMGVRASFSISLIVQDQTELWGLISCHDYGLIGRRVSFPMRELCRSIGACASINLEKLLYLYRIQARKPLTKAPPKVSPTSYVAASSSDLLEMFEAEFGFLAIRDEARTIGRLFAYNECLALLQYIRSKSYKVVFQTQSIASDCLDIVFPAQFTSISGMLVIPLSLSGSDFLVFFRKGQIKEVKWAGNPHEKKYRPGTSYLEPRASFRRWSEHVVGTSREWTQEQVESAGVLSALYGRFIEVWRQKEAIVQQNRMTRLLIRQAGADVRTPLNAIINYLEVALEEVLDEKARIHLEKSLSASRSLIFVVNDLLSLTEAEGDNDFECSNDTVLLDDLMNEVIKAFDDECQKKDLRIKFDHDTNVPATVKCDGIRLRQTIANLLSNTVRHSSPGEVVVGLKTVSNDATQADNEAKTPIEIYFEDSGGGLSEPELDGIFLDFEKVLDDDDAEASEMTEGKSTSIGIGLATTARFVRLNDGKITISSQPGNGTRVAISIPFRKADANQPLRSGPGQSHPSSPHNTSGTSPQTTPPQLPSEKSEGYATPKEALPTPTAPSKNPFSITTASVAVTPSPSLSTPAPQITPSSSTKLTSTNPNYQVQYPFPIMDLPPMPKERHLNVLVAEDNPLNSRILEERLRKRGYGVQVAVDGQICFDTVRAAPDGFDIVFMDLQMPRANGFESTRMIRAYEQEASPPISGPAKSYGRLPVIAVSASLLEQKRDEYIECGFDGWILKPINFERLEQMLKAVNDVEKRQGLLYGNVEWQKGGWFKSKSS